VGFRVGLEAVEKKKILHFVIIALIISSETPAEFFSFRLYTLSPSTASPSQKTSTRTSGHCLGNFPPIFSSLSSDSVGLFSFNLG
jgi:hypothetical protein